MADSRAYQTSYNNNPRKISYYLSADIYSIHSTCSGLFHFFETEKWCVVVALAVKVIQEIAIHSAT
jgi:hypothetical protein